MQKIHSALSPNHKSGFTLLEILVVLCVIALISTVAAINVVKLRERHTLESTAEKLANVIKSAKTAAINGGTGWVEVNVTAPSVGIKITTEIPVTPPLPTVILPNSISTQCPIPTNSTISFTVRTGEATFANSQFRDGQANCDARTIQLQSPSFNINITLDQQGNPTLGKPMPR